MKRNAQGWPIIPRKPKSYKKSAPPIQVQARLLGSIQWVCPSCSSLHGTTKVKWRHAWTTCRHCNHRYRLGVGFCSQMGVTLPPYNAIFAGEFLNYITNRVDTMPNGTPLVGRVMGNLDWVCPDCKTVQCSAPEWDLQALPCKQCAKIWYLRLIIYRSTPKHPIGTPFDWTPLLKDFANKRKYEKLRVQPDLETEQPGTSE